MNTRRHSAVRLGCLALAAAGAALGEPLSLDVTCDRTRIYLGESVLLTVRVSGRTDAPEPDLSALAPARHRLRDSQAQNVQQIVWVNGRLQRTGFVGRIFTYEVTPTQVGTFRTGPIRLTADGRTVTAEGPPVEVTGVEEQDWVHVRVQASRDSVLVEEPFDIVLSVRLRLPEDASSGFSPLDPASPPSLQASYLDGEPISGLVCPDVRDDLRRRIQSDRRLPAFTINRYTVRRDPFDMDRFFDMDWGRLLEEQPARFRLDERRLTENGQPYVEYTLTYSYTPREQGSYPFGPVLFKGEVITPRARGGGWERQRIFAVGPAVTVRVVPPPEEGRPPSFIGAVGRHLRVEASLDTQTCRVGDRLKLKLTVTGAVNPANVWPPDLTTQPGLTQAFRLYEESVQSVTREDRREFFYTLRPIQSGTLEIPALEVAYYDLNDRAYRTVKTAPLPLVVRPAAELTADAIISAATNRGEAAESGAAARAPAPMDPTPAGAEPRACRLSSAQRITGLAGPAACGAGLAAGWLACAWRAAVRRWRRRSLYAEARRALGCVPDGPSSEAADAARRAWTAARRYLAGRLGVPEAGLTPADARERLLGCGVPGEIAERLAVLLESLFNAGFAGGPDLPSHAWAREAREARRLLADLESHWNRRARSRPRLDILALLVGVGLAATAPAARAETLSGTRFLWDEANRRLGTASSREEFVEAARAYQALLETGLRNGPLFYNLGTAWLQAGEPAVAYAALIRAERYLGTTPEIKRNLERAYAALEGDASARLPWRRVIFFWHYGLPFPLRAWIALGGWTLAWAGWVLRRFGLREAARRVVWLGLSALVVYGSSAALTWHQERVDDALGAGLLPLSAPSAQEEHPGPVRTEGAGGGRS